MNVEQVTGKLVSWLQERVRIAHCHGLVLGMSGGIDSSVLAVLCQWAFPRSTLGVIMPCHSIPEDEEHALAVAKKFSISTRTVELDGAFDTLLQALPEDTGRQATASLARANIKPRLRMIALYYFANRLNYLVAGSGNRSELAVGYFTKYGDSGVDLLPLANLVKGEIREMARFLDIPQAIIDKPPSAGLWAGQTDEAEMGFSYQELDRYILTGDAVPGLKRKFDDRIASAAHKCRPPLTPDLVD